MNTFPLEEKVCLVTGGLGGIAMGVTKLILKRGGKVFLCDLRPEEEGLAVARKELNNDSVCYAKCDVTNEKEFDESFVKCRDRFGVPDVVINCAGIAGEQRWEQVYDVNVKGTHQAIELAFKHMSHRSDGGKGGVIVTLSSTSGITCIGDMYTTPAYTASKHAVTAMTRTFGHDFHFKRTGVRVVALAPYFVETQLVDDEFVHFTDDQEARNLIKEAAVGKSFLKTEEVALKLINILGAKNGTVWMIRPNQMQPFNIPDYKLPHTQGYRSEHSYLRPQLYC